MSKYGLDEQVAMPVATLQTVRQPIPWLALLNTLAIVGLFALLLTRGTSEPSPQPVPPTPVVSITEDVEKITAEAERKFIKNKAEAAERLAADLKAGKIVNSSQFDANGQAYQSAVEKDAFAGMVALNQKYVRESGDKWTPEQIKLIIELQERKAKGYRGMLK